MAFYTGNGDNGTTKLFGSNERTPKDAGVFEALGTLDELNSLLGMAKVTARRDELVLPKKEESVAGLLHQLQHDIFTIQAELAGADKRVGIERVRELEKLTVNIERSLPEVATFLVPGGSELSAQLDVCRTVTRRAERRVVAAKSTASDETLAYMNRLSSVLYALVRLVNHERGVTEEPPRYC